MRWGGHLNLIWKGILLRMYAQQPPVELLHQCEREAVTDKYKSNKKTVEKPLTSIMHN